MTGDLIRRENLNSHTQKEDHVMTQKTAVFKPKGEDSEDSSSTVTLVSDI